MIHVVLRPVSHPSGSPPYGRCLERRSGGGGPSGRSWRSPLGQWRCGLRHEILGDRNRGRRQVSRPVCAVVMSRVKNIAIRYTSPPAHRSARRASSGDCHQQLRFLPRHGVGDEAMIGVIYAAFRARRPHRHSDAAAKSISKRERRVLDAIDNHLADAAPELALLLATFTLATAGQDMPACETIRADADAASAGIATVPGWGRASACSAGSRPAGGWTTERPGGQRIIGCPCGHRTTMHLLWLVLAVALPGRPAGPVRHRVRHAGTATARGLRP